MRRLRRIHSRPRIQNKADEAARGVRRIPAKTPVTKRDVAILRWQHWYKIRDNNEIT